MDLGLETFSYHLAFGRGKMDIFGFINKAVELGMSGVQINIGAGPPAWGHLGGNDPAFLREVRSEVEHNGLYIEIDTQKTEPDYLTTVLDMCAALGVEVLRTYEKPSGDIEHDMDRAVENLRSIVPACSDLGIRIAFENHEYETSDDVRSVIGRVNSEWVGTLVDTGNSMMVWEDPERAVKALAPYAVSSHYKDHVVIVEDDMLKVAGVAIGSGSMDCAECFWILAEDSPLTRINIEVCYDYRAPFRREKPADFSEDFAAFAVRPAPYDPSWIAPSSHLRTRQVDANLVEWQDQAVRTSVAYVKMLRDALPGGAPPVD
jgi:sugar phosphate isomerase/epimerase